MFFKDRGKFTLICIADLFCNLIDRLFCRGKQRGGFFPTISEEYRAIRDAMKMRGIRMGGKNPFLMVEYRLVPLMVSVVKIGDELSAAALTRGLGAPVKRTNVCKIGFHIQDLIVCIICILCFAVFLFEKYGA